ncbi:cinnamycin family lantibiotic [Kamptonema formosum]|uniref:cinnamycin family lantibiotic n=1 Tax=Kamptonema formosum TaxID=331992 RepID=UPI000348E915|nr:cinnamycin family lantibiotic [Oscillatoria sp. PCC 10802]
MSNSFEYSVLEKPSVEDLELLLQRSVIDGEFRSELVDNPEAFGIAADREKIELPKPVEQQDMSFVELVTEDNIFAECGSTCVSGFTILCDGNTQPNCRRTCVSGWTIRCDGATV